MSMQIKPLFMTVEFWIAMATNVCGILVVSGVITPDQSSDVVTAVQSIVGGLLSVLSTFKIINTQTTRSKLAVGLSMELLKAQTAGDKGAVSMAQLDHAFKNI